MVLGSMRDFRWVALLAALLLSCSPAVAQAADQRSATVIGGGLFVSKGCYQCHGLVGQGSLTTGPAIAPPRLPSSAFKAYVRRPSGLMPLYSAKLLPDAELEAIIAYLNTLPRPGAASQIPLLAPFVQSKGRQPQ